MITGYDTVFVTGARVDAGIRVMLDDLHHRWPSMVVAFGDERFASWKDVRNDVPPGTGEVLVARDPLMEQRWDDAGYSLMEHNEGPFMVLYQLSVPPMVEIQLNEDPMAGLGSPSSRILRS